MQGWCMLQWYVCRPFLPECFCAFGSGDQGTCSYAGRRHPFHGHGGWRRLRKEGWRGRGRKRGQLECTRALLCCNTWKADALDADASTRMPQGQRCMENTWLTQEHKMEVSVESMHSGDHNLNVSPNNWWYLTMTPGTHSAGHFHPCIPPLNPSCWCWGTHWLSCRRAG